MGKDLQAIPGSQELSGAKPYPGLPAFPNFAPKAKRVIWLFQSGGPSQMELFDYKPQLTKWRGQDLPASIVKGQRLTSMTSNQEAFPVVDSFFKFEQHGESGAWVSELLPHTAKIVDDICIVKSMHTEAINHDPAITFFQTGAQIAGRPSIGAWLAYGLGSESSDLPAFVVMITKGAVGQPLYDRLWGSGFLPTKFSGVKFRSVGDPVLYLSDPSGFDRERRRLYLDALSKMNQMKLSDFGDPEISTRIAQYEMAFRMQASVPDLTDLSDETKHTFQLYGEDAQEPGTFAYNCLLARRLAERGVASSCSSTGAGTTTALCQAHSPSSARPPTTAALPSSRISKSAVCSMKRWSFGAGNSAARCTARVGSPKTTTAVTTIRAVSRCG